MGRIGRCVCLMLLLLAHLALGLEPPEAEDSAIPTVTPAPPVEAMPATESSPPPVHSDAPVQKPEEPPPDGGVVDKAAAPGFEAAPPPTRYPYALPFSYQLGMVYFFQAGGGDSFTGEFAWTPLVDFGAFGLRGDFGFSVPKNALNDHFLAFRYLLYGRIGLGESLHGELGAGGQTFTGDIGGTHVLVSVNLAYNLHGGWLDRLYLGYSRYWSTPATNGIHLGVGFDL